MAITASGLYGVTLEKMMIDTLAKSIEAETHKGMLVTDTYTHAYDTHSTKADITNEVSGAGYTAGGGTLTTTEVTIGSPAAGTLKFDHDDESWSASTITSAMAMVAYFATDAELIYLLDFVTAVSTVSGLLTVQIAANGVFNLDYTP